MDHLIYFLTWPTLLGLSAKCLSLSSTWCREAPFLISPKSLESCFLISWLIVVCTGVCMCWLFSYLLLFLLFEAENRTANVVPQFIGVPALQLPWWSTAQWNDVDGCWVMWQRCTCWSRSVSTVDGGESIWIHVCYDGWQVVTQEFSDAAPLFDESSERSTCKKFYSCSFESTNRGVSGAVFYLLEAKDRKSFRRSRCRGSRCWVWWHVWCDCWCNLQMFLLLLELFLLFQSPSIVLHFQNRQ